MALVEDVLIYFYLCVLWLAWLGVSMITEVRMSVDIFWGKEEGKEGKEGKEAETVL